MKKVHLVCNSHIDPVWMWDWDDGVGAAISTFRSAAELLGEFDFVFCHNEAYLYERIEQCAPDLFADIQRLVAEGKWRISGGWWLQPDVIFPSGEALMRQIIQGREYFSEKFGVMPTIAYNFDSFGHHRGMVQILAKTGYEGYIFCRPMKEITRLKESNFIWQSADGSKIKAFWESFEGLYCTNMGEARTGIEKRMELRQKDDVSCALWGVGNHGGVPSRKDLRDIEALQKEKANDVEIVHSNPEAFFAEMQPNYTFKEYLPCFVKGYSSMHRMKEAHAELEWRLYTTEKLCAVSAAVTSYEPNMQVFKQAERDLATVQFHDVMSGTCAIDGEKSSIEKTKRSVASLAEENFKAFCALVATEKRAAPNSYPIFVFSPYAQETEAVVETEFLLPQSMELDTEYREIVAYCDGKQIPSQVVKELSNINYDRRKRVAMRVKLAPMSLTRVDCYLELRPKKSYAFDEAKLVLTDACKTVTFNRETGLLESFIVNGKEYLSAGAFEPFMFEDNADPWGWNMTKVGKNGKKFSLTKNDEFYGKASGMKIVEDGDVLTTVESCFLKNRSCVTVTYKVYKNMPYIDVQVTVLWNEKNKALKLKVPAAFGERYVAQSPYSREYYPRDGREIPAQRFSALTDGERALGIYNECVTGQSCQGKTMWLTLLNGSAYCAHPIGNRPLVDEHRDIRYIEEGRHFFSFRMSATTSERLETESNVFVQKPYSVSYFPGGDGKSASPDISVSNEYVTMPVCKRSKDGKIVFRLFNNTEKSQSTRVRICGEEKTARIGKHAFETFGFDGKKIYKIDTTKEFV